MSTPPTSLPNVLVVEDEMILRMRAVDIVEDAGFCPVEAVNADEAISILESRSDISLLFSDIQMPGTMDGLKLAHAVHDRWPAIKIVLVSGQVKPSETETPADSRFFRKPLAVDEMISQLQTMIGAGALKILPTTTDPGENLGVARSPQESVLVAENDNLRLLLEQADTDAKVLLAQAGIEAHEREAADKLQKLILGELHHRIKNTLATVSAIAAQSFRAAINLEQGQKAMDGRLLALGRAHDLLIQVSWSNASLTHTLSGATDPYDGQGGRRFHFNGPDLRITSGAVIALAMTFNELCTNTTKFGALSSSSGHVEIAWTVDEIEQRLRLKWSESGGPVVAPPARRSYGTRMIESLGQQLNGQVRLAYEPSGFVYQLDVPLKSVMASNA
ncbi:sensor histidine kinase [Bradyrhizobium canariense]|uniref:sensor histidine kinase n=1 Tax=Bradyrhizobium canariense TaxID=255045 RepID=UPI000A1933F1|nr:HWE histidine kinase domain-containing protein [Bradyrhizobium canariense]OSI20548.1 histidine kinase [Bradyrhizobium canariense]OSI34432.1 histidine kinase [Bradyrhizobium canariense]OSI39687.1 histidine kinase [Bradyrhizobium canariense]OSI47710.1 histidine kinase [Bradyrhizobium canariense]OSI56727.1 histidine kinase [Bradyrhizobium canariense]